MKADTLPVVRSKGIKVFIMLLVDCVCQSDLVLGGLYVVGLEPCDREKQNFKVEERA